MINSFERIVESILVSMFLFGLHLVSPEMVGVGVGVGFGDDVLCLQGIKTSLQDPLHRLSSWDFTKTSAASYCNLQSQSGISCQENRIIRIILPSWGLSGQIPESFKYCQRLRTLILSVNRLSGTIPTELCTWLPDLETLNLSYNNMSGPIPPSLAKCKSLNTLVLSDNRFSGTIPNELSTLVSLTRLSLANNILSGPIPPSLNGVEIQMDFAGNSGLCGEPLEKCGSVARKTKSALMIAAFGVFAAVISISILFGLWWFKFRAVGVGVSNEPIDHGDVLGMPRRFSYRNIEYMTDNFSNKLGEGGFGSVFEGTLNDGTKVAVKRLIKSLDPIKDSFFAEVKSVGSIHHVNLVSLVGFCMEKTHRILIYEYMANASLDRWIFRKADDQFVLTWQQRKKIVLDIAKGLNYLHVECHHKIIHLDIKPQNILLDDNFNAAKVSDFGLSKMTNKDQSQVVMNMRGTPGYLAPEWLSGVITEKADVYSFGVVILEIVCGRKVFDVSCNEEDRYLLTLLKRKNEENQLLDVVNISAEDVQIFGIEAVNMLKLAAWCLQGDYTKRPSMSMAIKVLEGSLQVKDDLDYNFWCKPVKVYENFRINDAMHQTVCLPSILSGPR